ncbi:hypothetical protein J437_LFUL019176 [Ladona fulva]|uniref:Uncharacterized protein n=1 Tax=Ladona fulva TaxID=123851 RepID=A0A8K0PBG5_LADFU|nr:hypothetical protein J437_LFUL019176 [Ladona fulva]
MSEAFSIAEELDDSGSEIFGHSKLEMFLVRCSQLETVYLKFCDAQTKILEYCHNCNQADVFLVGLQVGEEVVEKYYFILSISSRVVNPSTTNELTRVDNGPTPSTKSRLPTIELPRFSGAFSDWIGFRDLFKSVVHDRSDIASVEKFAYLKASLQGKALALIASVPFGDAHHDSAWKELWEFILFRLASRVVDAGTLSLFEETLNDEPFPSVTQLLSFVKKRIKAIGLQGDSRKACVVLFAKDTITLRCIPNVILGKGIVLLFSRPRRQVKRQGLLRVRNRRSLRPLLRRV